VPGKDFGRATQVPQGQVATLWWSFSGAAKQKQNKAASGAETGTFKMMFTGTMIEDLIATVERAEAKVQDQEMTEVEPWFASAQENANYDSKLLRLA
jgi:hypothetical protein